MGVAAEPEPFVLKLKVRKKLTALINILDSKLFRICKIGSQFMVLSSEKFKIDEFA